MKLQHLAVIFILIIMPITMVISTYVGKLIDVSNKEAMYDTVLMNATYDAVRAYQINTINNSFASVNSSRVRDVNASLNSYFNSLGIGLSSKGYSRNELEEYVPAILFTLYDGFYVYGPFENYTNVSGNEATYNEQDSNKNTQYGLKPYNYYTCEYQNGNDYHIIVNYTLDNYISIVGRYNDGGTEKYITESGYYINPNKISSIDDDSKTVTLSDGIVITPEELGEYVYVYNSKVIPQNVGNRTVNLKGKLKYYRYINYNEEKYYYDDSMDEEDEADASLSYVRNNGVEDTDKPIPIFYLDKNLKIYISDNMLETLAANRDCDKEDLRTGNVEAFKDINNYYYYKNAKEFSEKVYPVLSRINIGDDVVKSAAYRNEGGYKVEAQASDGTKYAGTHQKFIFDTSNGKIFDYNYANNDPETESSFFNQHRMDVIISDVEANLANTIYNFNKYQYASYEYRMPMIREDDWYKVANNVNVLSFLQGFAIGNYKFYNNYSIVSDTKNKEFISKESIYVQKDIVKQNFGDVYDNNQTGLLDLYSANNNDEFYHDPRCAQFHYDMKNNYASDPIIAYRAIDYEADSFSHDFSILGWSEDDPSVPVVTGEDSESVNYYMQSGTGGYECTVSKNDPFFSYDDLIIGAGTELELTDKTKKTSIYSKIRTAFLSALAREKGAAFKNLEALKIDTDNVTDQLTGP